MLAMNVLLESPAMERRITLRLLAYWEKLRRGRTMPAEDDINPDDLKDLWANCFLVHTADLGKPGYNYTYLGDAIAAAWHAGLHADDVEFVPVSPHAAHLTSACAQVIAIPKPLVDEGEFRNLHNQIVRYRQCLLPLGEGDKVQAIFGGMRFKVLPA